MSGGNCAFFRVSALGFKREEASIALQGDAPGPVRVREMPYGVRSLIDAVVVNLARCVSRKLPLLQASAFAERRAPVFLTGVRR